MEPLMIEVALNEQSDRHRYPNVPCSVDEVVADAVACVDAGAAIVHFHARDPETGMQRWRDTQFYVDAITRIRAANDAIVYPTQEGYAWENMAHVFELADQGLLEWSTIDVFPGRWVEGEPPRDVQLRIMAELKDRGVPFSLGVREVGHMRHVEQYIELGLLERVVLKIFFDEGLVGPRPDARGLLMYLDSAPPGFDCHWFTTLYEGSPRGHTLRRLSMLAAAMGGHIRTGLGDNPELDGDSTWTNVQQVEMAAALARAAGRDVATPAQARQILGIGATR